MILKKLGRQIITSGMGVVTKIRGHVFPFIAHMVKRWKTPISGCSTECEGVNATASVGNVTAKGIRNLSNDDLLLILLA